MRKFIVGSAVVAMVGAAIALPHAAAQDTELRSVQWITSLEPGASIGVSIRDLNNQEIAQAGLAQPGGVRIEEVRSGSPAAAAGFQTGDIVVEFDGERVRSSREFTRLVQETPAGRTVSASILRGGERMSLQVTPESGGATALRTLPQLNERLRDRLYTARPFAYSLDLPRTVVTTTTGRLGATLMPLDGQLAEYFGVSRGVLVSSVTDNTPAADAGLRAGDVITAIGGTAVSTVNEAARLVRQSSAGSPVEITVTRDRKETSLTVTLR